MYIHKPACMYRMPGIACKWDILFDTRLHVRWDIAKSACVKYLSRGTTHCLHNKRLYLGWRHPPKLHHTHIQMYPNFCIWFDFNLTTKTRIQKSISFAETKQKSTKIQNPTQKLKSRKFYLCSFWTAENKRVVCCWR